jgi:hypothetical protein
MRELGVMGEEEVAKGRSEGLTLPPLEVLVEDLSESRWRRSAGVAGRQAAREAHLEMREAEVAEEDSDALVEFKDEVPDETEPERVNKPIAR